ncbi:HAD family hydrolase [Holdemania massiliensis]|uniref:HAD family hydrolase n=1 Tax=Holdemania massiliensis TaxID=1468449 RepID=UPI003522D692
MKAYTHLVFDIDGTLLNTEMAVLHSLQWALQQHGIVQSVEQLRFALGIPGKDALVRFDLDHPEQVLRQWDAKYIEYLQEVTIFDGIVPLLQTLRKHRVACGVITSKTQIELAQDFQALGLQPYFDVIITADDTQKHKPDGEPMRMYLKRSGAEAAETIYIGDADYDLQCAHHAGCDSALAVWGRSDRPSTQPTWTLHQVSDVLKLAGLDWDCLDRTSNQ